MEHPGFSYFLLPQIKKYVIPIKLREGVGDRKAAVCYMKALIKGSEYAKYADQAGEFMAQFPGTKFSQTDVLTAYEQFEAWCLNKNILQAYHYDISEEFMLDRDAHGESFYDKLKKLVGLKIVKEQILTILLQRILLKKKGNKGKVKIIRQVLCT